MRKYSVLTATISALLLALISTPAHASVPADGTYLCTTGAFSSATPNYTITDGVVSDGASCAGAVVIPAGVTSIGDEAFESATALTSVTIPASVTSIGTSAFESATALTSVTIPASVTSIGTSAFLNATSLTSITFDGTSTLTSIGVYAFYGTTSLTSITLPASVTSIGVGAFFRATSLTSITIPASVTSIGDSAFDKATSLTSITFDGTSTLTSLGGFHGATSLTSITIPASVTSIGDNAFRDANSLTSVFFLGDAPTAGTNAFTSVAAGAKAYIKTGANGFVAIGSVWNNLTVAMGVYNVTYNSSGGSVVASGAFIEDGDISQAPTQPTQSGYTFTGWSATDGGSTVTFPYTPTSNSDLMLYATWSVSAVATTPIVANAYRADKLATVYFSPLSSKLSKADKKKLEAAVIANPSAVYKITGHVQKSIFAKNAKNDASLSLARAKAIETHLSSLVSGVTFTVVTDAGKVPVKNGKSKKARRATLYVMTPVVQ